MSEGNQRLMIIQYDTATGVLNTESVYERCKDRSDISGCYCVKMLYSFGYELSCVLA